MKNGEDMMIDGAKLVAAADLMVSMFDREIFDYVIASDAGGAALASIVAYRLKKGLVMPCMDAPAGKYIIVGFEMGDGKLVEKEVEKVKKATGSIVKMGFVYEESSRRTRRTLFRGIPVESINMI